MNPRWREALREAGRNLVSGTTHVWRWTLVLALILGGLAWLETSTIRTVVNNAADHVSRGGATWVLQATGGIWGTSCDQLAKADGVLASGALRVEDESLTAIVLPRGPVPVKSVTPGFLSLIGASDATGLVVSDLVANRLSMTTPAQLSTTTGVIEVTGHYPYPEDGRRPGLGFAALAPVPGDQAFDECWLTVWPSDDQITGLAYLALIGGGSSAASEAKLAQMNPRFSTSLDTTSQYESRLTRWSGVAAASAGILLGFAACWQRRLEVASSIHVGLPRSFLLIRLEAEAAVWALAAGLLAAPMIVVGSWSAASDLRAVQWAGARVLLAGVAGPLLGTLVAWTGIRQRQLFALFKTR
ncbi:MAG: hypothetical protein LBV06_04850 [Propionibacteriaceae bacterium]|jgi:hypothetical protein|nr:hypothetical protein [Propionibacteriaceae bacterium]